MINCLWVGFVTWVGADVVYKSLEDKLFSSYKNIEEIVEIDEGEHDSIAQVLQKGYKIGDKVLRPVSVKVYSYASEEVKENIEQENNFKNIIINRKGDF